ncbi:hypothetical protein N7540_001145 [Penicillium herquei]|nr:hypothetical protein N7540_001145 [Penicillium herquei]
MHANTGCMELHSFPSPALKEIDSKYYPVKFNGTLDYPSIYRQDPSPEVDEAWNRLEDIRIMSISEDDVLKAGKTTDAIQIPQKWGGGYMASLEVNHQLHCVNFLRKSLFRDYYQTRSVEFSDHPEMIHTHLLHCVEMLRQFVMCHADVGVITHNWVEDYPRPYPDFNTWHQCRNFENVLQWAKDHEMQGPPYGPSVHHKWTPEPGAKIFASPP